MLAATVTLVRPVNEAAARNMQKLEGKLEGSGFFGVITELRGKLNLPKTVTEGRISHRREYISAILEAAMNIDKNARDFAKLFLRKAPVYSNTDTGMTALQLEAYLLDDDTILFQKFVETQIQAAVPTFLAIFQGKLNKDERTRLERNTQTFMKFEVRVNGGDVAHGEGIVSDVCILECKPVGGKKAKTEPPEKGSDRKPGFSPAVESIRPKTLEDYQQVRDEGGIDTKTFKLLYGEKALNEATMFGKQDALLLTQDGKDIAWMFNGDKWVPEVPDEDYDENLMEKELGEGMEVANTIKKQLGGKALYMLGAKNISGDGKSLSMRIGRNKLNANILKITLTGMDLYDIEFGSMRGGKYKVKKLFKGVYADQMHKIIQDATGAALSLTKRYEDLDEAALPKGVTVRKVFGARAGYHLRYRGSNMGDVPRGLLDGPPKLKAIPKGFFTEKELQEWVKKNKTRLRKVVKLMDEFYSYPDEGHLPRAAGRGESKELYQEGEDNYHSSFESWRIEKKDDDTVIIHIQDKLYEVEATMEDARELLDGAAECYEDLPEEYDLTIEKFLHEYSEAEGRPCNFDSVSKSGGLFEDTNTSGELIRERNEKIARNAKLRLLAEGKLSLEQHEYNQFLQALTRQVKNLQRGARVDPKDITGLVKVVRELGGKAEVKNVTRDIKVALMLPVGHVDAKTGKVVREGIDEAVDKYTKFFFTDKKIGPLILRNPVVNRKALGGIGIVTGIQVNAEGDDVASKGFTERRQIISLDAVRKQVKMRMDKHYAMLVKETDEGYGFRKGGSEKKQAQAWNRKFVAGLPSEVAKDSSKWINAANYMRTAPNLSPEEAAKKFVKSYKEDLDETQAEGTEPKTLQQLQKRWPSHSFQKIGSGKDALIDISFGTTADQRRKWSGSAQSRGAVKEVVPRLNRYLVRITETEDLDETQFDKWDIKDTRELGKKYRDEFKKILKANRGGDYVGYRYERDKGYVMVIGKKGYVLLDRKGGKLVGVATGMIHETEIDDIGEGVDEDEKFTAAIAKAIQKQKKAAGIKSIRQNYKGTGSKKARRQLWIKFTNGAVIDIWIEPNTLVYGGVVTLRADGKRVRPSTPGTKVAGLTPERIAATVARDLKAWSEDTTEDMDEDLDVENRCWICGESVMSWFHGTGVECKTCAPLSGDKKKVKREAYHQSMRERIAEVGNIEALIKYWKGKLKDAKHPWRTLHAWALKHPDDITGDPKAWAAWMHNKVFGEWPATRAARKEKGKLAASVEESLIGFKAHEFNHSTYFPTYFPLETDESILESMEDIENEFVHDLLEAAQDLLEALDDPIIAEGVTELEELLAEAEQIAEEELIDELREDIEETRKLLEGSEALAEKSAQIKLTVGKLVARVNGLLKEEKGPENRKHIIKAASLLAEAGKELQPFVWASESEDLDELQEATYADIKKLAAKFDGKVRRQGKFVRVSLDPLDSASFRKALKDVHGIEKVSQQSGGNVVINLVPISEGDYDDLDELFGDGSFARAGMGPNKRGKGRKKKTITGKYEDDLDEGSGTVPAISQFVDKHTVDNYPYGAKKTTAVFEVIGKPGKMSVQRTTVNPKTGQPTKPKRLTYGYKAIIGLGKDGRTYPVMLGAMRSHITVWSGNMKHSLASVFPDEPDFASLAKGLGLTSKFGESLDEGGYPMPHGMSDGKMNYDSRRKQERDQALKDAPKKLAELKAARAMAQGLIQDVYKKVKKANAEEDALVVLAKVKNAVTRMDLYDEFKRFAENMGFVDPSQLGIWESEDTLQDEWKEMYLDWKDVFKAYKKNIEKAQEESETEMSQLLTEGVVARIHEATGVTREQIKKQVASAEAFAPWRAESAVKITDHFKTRLAAIKKQFPDEEELLQLARVDHSTSDMNLWCAFDRYVSRNTVVDLASYGVTALDSMKLTEGYEASRLEISAKSEKAVKDIPAIKAGRKVADSIVLDAFALAEKLYPDMSTAVRALQVNASLGQVSVYGLYRSFCEDIAGITPGDAGVYLGESLLEDDRSDFA